LTWNIEIALHEAGVQLYGIQGGLDSGMRGTGIVVYLPVGADASTHPLIEALKNAGLNPSYTHHNPELSKIRTDIPVIFVGEKFPGFSVPPYNPPNAVQWTVLPLLKQ
jgi:hypothetical protein